MPAALAPSQSFLNQAFVDAALARPEPSVALTNTKRTPAARTDFHLMATPPSWLWAETSMPRKVPDGAASAPGARASMASVENVTETDTASTAIERCRRAGRQPARAEERGVGSVDRRSVIGPPMGFGSAP